MPRSKASASHLTVRLMLHASILAAGCAKLPPAAVAPKPHQLAVTGAGHALNRITSDEVDESAPRISPDGKTLLLTTRALGVDGKLALVTIVGVNPDTGASRTLYTASTNFSEFPAWLPDGSSFVYSSNQPGEWCLVKALSAAPNAAITVMVNGQSAPIASKPDVSPDGKRVAFHTTIRDTLTVAIADTDGAHMTLLGEGEKPRWSPDGKRLVFQRSVTGTWHIFTIDAETGTGLVQITSGTFQNYDPAWSPDGRFIVFDSNRGSQQRGGSADGTFNLFLVKPDGTGLTQLTDGDGIADEPDWGKDGYLYFRSNQAGSFDIWRLKPVGEFAASVPSPASAPSLTPALNASAGN